MKIDKKVETKYLIELSNVQYKTLVSYLQHCLKDRNRNFDAGIDYIVSEMLKNM